MSLIRVAAVSYLNTRPLLYGICNHPVLEQITLVEDYPAKIAQLLINDEVDLGLIPVAAIPFVPDAQIITYYCIGAEGPVASVCLFSAVPMAEVTHVFMDYQSRTSVILARILLKEYWKKDVTFINATGEDYRSKITGTVAGVVIGDRALEQRLISDYIYDLAEAWIDHTGLPFVFAAWVANKKLTAAFKKDFNEANATGLASIEAVLSENNSSVYPLKKYYTTNIDYFLSNRKKKGLKLFLQKFQAMQN